MKKLSLVAFAVLSVSTAIMWMYGADGGRVREVVVDSDLIGQQLVIEPESLIVDELTPALMDAKTSSDESAELGGSSRDSALPESIDDANDDSLSVPEEVAAEVFTTVKFVGKVPDELSQLFYDDELLAHAVKKKKFVASCLERNKELANYKIAAIECRKHLCRLEVSYTGNELDLLVRTAYRNKLSRHRVGFSVSAITAHDVDGRADMAVVYFQPWIFK